MHNEIIAHNDSTIVNIHLKEDDITLLMVLSTFYVQGYDLKKANSVRKITGGCNIKVSHQLAIITAWYIVLVYMHALYEMNCLIYK